MRYESMNVWTGELTLLLCNLIVGSVCRHTGANLRSLVVACSSLTAVLQRRV